MPIISVPNAVITPKAAPNAHALKRGIVLTDLSIKHPFRFP